VCELNPRERAVLMNPVYHRGEIRNIAIIPHAGFSEGLYIRGRMKITRFGRGNSQPPSAFIARAAHMVSR